MRLYTNIMTVIREKPKHDHRYVHGMAYVKRRNVLYEEPIKPRFIQFIDPVECIVAVFIIVTIAYL